MHDFLFALRIHNGKKRNAIANFCKPMTELFTFKLRQFNDNVNGLRQNYWSIFSSSFTGWERTGHMLCIVNTSLSVLMTMRMCLRELCCLFGIFYCLDLNHLVSVFYLFIFS